MDELADEQPDPPGAQPERRAGDGAERRVEQRDRRIGRRGFMKRVGMGGAGALAVGAPIGTFFVGDHMGERREVGKYASSVVAGQGRGRANVWWSVDADEKVLALTFDDGPTEQFTGRVLDILGEYDVTASFFMIGEMVQRRPDDVRRAIAEGHEVANHTWDHHSAAKQDAAELRATMEKGADAIADLLGHRPRWFRPVKGHVTGALLRVASDLGHDVAIWTYGRGPAKGEPDELEDDDVPGIQRYMIDQLQDGAIVILHDGIGRSAWEWTGVDERLVRQRDAEVRALPAVIERYLAEGYRFLSVSELIDRYGDASRLAPTAADPDDGSGTEDPSDDVRTDDVAPTTTIEPPTPTE